MGGKAVCKVVVFGARGAIGRRITAELLGRKHEVTAVTRDGIHPDAPLVGLRTVAADASDAQAITAVVRGHDAVISSLGPAAGHESAIVTMTRALLEGVRAAGVQRLLAVGGAGSLEVAPGLRLVDSPDFPLEYRPIALAHAEALDLYLGVEDLEWTSICPPPVIEAGERTGSYRVGGGDLLVDSDGTSRITIEDYAVAVVDELERGTAVRRRITVAY